MRCVARFPLQPVPTSGLGEDKVPFYENIGVSQDDEALPLPVESGGQ